MTRPFVYRPPNPHARRAGVLLLVLGGLALVMGLLLIAAGTHLTELMQNPAVAERIEDLRKQSPIDLKAVIIGQGIVVTAYAITALLLGGFVRGGHFAVIVVTLVMSILVAIVAGLMTLLGLAVDPAGALLTGIVSGLHALAASWLIVALRQPTLLPAATPGVYHPMQEYYLPPLPPAARV